MHIDRLRAITGWTIISFWIVFFTWLLVSCASAHENYPYDCCHEEHCHPVPCNEITYHDGYYIWHDIYFNEKLLRTEVPGCHVCVSMPANKLPQPLCIFVGGQS